MNGGPSELQWNLPITDTTGPPFWGTILIIEVSFIWRSDQTSSNFGDLFSPVNRDLWKGEKWRDATCSMDPKLTLSYEDFEGLAEKLVQRSKEIGDSWELRKTTSTTPGPGSRAQGVNNPLHYLVKKCTLVTRKRTELMPREEMASDLDDLAGDTSGIAEEEEADVASLDRSRGEGGRAEKGEWLVHMEYHVVHSVSYQVPILYFTASYLNGQALTLEQIWDLITPDYVSHGTDKWGMVTQQEHPYLGRPFYHIHPCHTATVVGRALQCSSRVGGDTPPTSNYLMTWLSTFAPVVGLEFSIKYAH